MTLTDALVADTLRHGPTVASQATLMALRNVRRLKLLGMPMGVYLTLRIADLRTSPDTPWNRAVVATYEAVLRGEPL